MSDGGIDKANEQSRGGGQMNETEKVLDGAEGPKVHGDGRTVLRFADGPALIRWFKSGGDEYVKNRRVEVGWMHRTHCDQRADRGQECSCSPRALLFLD